ncbi:MAG: OmpH family outer membrane protein [Deltaproteobacteria bacterium]|nr:OmpH family outer membrane protein [Deltaproteobacteria bacterium]
MIKSLESKGIIVKCWSARGIAEEAPMAYKNIEEVVEVVQDIGKKEGYTLIVEKRTGGVVYAPTSIDITDSVIQIYNAQPPKSDDAPAAPATEKKKK